MDDEFQLAFNEVKRVSEKYNLKLTEIDIQDFTRVSLKIKQIDSQQVGVSIQRILQNLEISSNQI